MANYVETEYNKLKGLLEVLTNVSQAQQDTIVLHDAEMAMKGNAGNPEALGNLERNLRNARVRILSELQGIIADFK
jgi:hypothetical protein